MVPTSASKGRMELTRRPDFWSGVFFLVLGASACIYALLSYRIGTPARMGPGFFPALVGGVIALVGAVILGIDLRAAWKTHDEEREKINPFGLLPLVTTVTAVVAFALLLRPLGLIVSLFAMVLISRLAKPGSWREMLALATTIFLIAYLIFSVGLRMPFKVVPW